MPSASDNLKYANRSIRSWYEITAIFYHTTPAPQQVVIPQLVVLPRAGSLCLAYILRLSLAAVVCHLENLEYYTTRLSLHGGWNMVNQEPAVLMVAVALVIAILALSRI